jgi:hypothetical protein
MKKKTKNDKRKIRGKTKEFPITYFKKTEAGDKPAFLFQSIDQNKKK